MNEAPIIRREWAMPSPDTFSIPAIAAVLKRYLKGVSVDPFARNSMLATHRNDLNPTTTAPHHLDAAEFCALLGRQGVVADVALFDPPYSPRQIAEVYQAIGREAHMAETQNGALYARVRDALCPLLKPGGIAISCGWNSAGFGKGRGFVPIEILLVAHGGAHNDTIVVVEKKAQSTLEDS